MITPGETALLFTAAAQLTVALAALINSLRNRGTIKQIEKSTDGMTARLETAAHAAGVLSEQTTPAHPKKHHEKS